MTPRTRSRRDDEDMLDPVAAADIDPDEDEDQEDPDLEDGSDEPDLFDDDEDAFDDDLEPEVGEEPSGEVPDELVVDDDVEQAAIAPSLPPDAEFDDDTDDIVKVVVGDDDDDIEDGIDGLRDGEFVCRSCFLAKRETQLADTERLLCRDCA